MELSFKSLIVPFQWIKNVIEALKIEEKFDDVVYLIEIADDSEYLYLFDEISNINTIEYMKIEHYIKNNISRFDPRYLWIFLIKLSESRNSNETLQQLIALLLKLENTANYLQKRKCQLLKYLLRHSMKKFINYLIDANFINFGLITLISYINQINVCLDETYEENKCMKKLLSEEYCNIAKIIRNDDVDKLEFFFEQEDNVEIINCGISKSDLIEEKYSMLDKLTISLVLYAIINGSELCFNYLMTYTNFHDEVCDNVNSYKSKAIIGGNINIFQRLSEFSDDNNPDDLRISIKFHRGVFFDYYYEKCNIIATQEMLNYCEEQMFLHGYIKIYNDLLENTQNQSIGMKNLLSIEEPTTSDLSPQMRAKKLKRERNKQKQMHMVELRKKRAEKEKELKLMKNEEEKDQKNLSPTFEQAFNVIRDSFNPETAEMLICSIQNKDKGTHCDYSTKAKLAWISKYSELGFSKYEKFAKSSRGPSVSSIKRWIDSGEFYVINPSLMQDISRLSEIVNFWKSSFNIHNVIKGVLAVDALKISESININSKSKLYGLIKPIQVKNPMSLKKNTNAYESISNENIQTNNIITHCFVFMFCPLTTIRSFPIQLIFTNTGIATQEVLDAINSLPMQLSSLGLSTFCIGSDADRKYSDIQHQCFMFYYDQIITSIEFLNVKNCKTPDFLFCNDPSHILKRLRSRLVKFKILYIVSSPKYKNQCISLEKINKFDPSIPTSSLYATNFNSMDDFHPKFIYSTKCLTGAYKFKDFSALIYLLPGTAMNIILRGKNISRLERLKIAYVGYFTMLIEYSIIKFKSMKKYKGKNNYEVFFKVEMMEHSILYFICAIKALTEIQESFPMGSLGSLCCEHYFGRTRNEARADDTQKAFIEAIKRLFIRDCYSGLEFNYDRRRWFETALVEEGLVNLSDFEIFQIFSFCITLFEHVGISIQPECSIYQYIQMKQMISDYELDSFIKLMSKAEIAISQSDNVFELSFSQIRKKSSNKKIQNRYCDQLFTKTKEEVI